MLKPENEKSIKLGFSHEDAKKVLQDAINLIDEYPEKFAVCCKIIPKFQSISVAFLAIRKAASMHILNIKL